MRNHFRFASVLFLGGIGAHAVNFVNLFNTGFRLVGDDLVYFCVFAFIGTACLILGWKLLRA